MSDLKSKIKECFDIKSIIVGILTALTIVVVDLIFNLGRNQTIIVGTISGFILGQLFWREENDAGIGKHIIEVVLAFLGAAIVILIVLLVRMF